MPTKSKPITVINPGISGVVYDEAGHSLGGGERIAVDELDEVGEAAMAAGQLIQE